ncbi:MAG: YdbH domain-containing protein [Rhodospirillales bacterium]|nr:YdbH domain-containing protein [Rhodospirillales bacterium]
MKRSILALIFVAIAAVAIGVVYITVPWIAAWMIGGYLADKGFPEAKFQVAAIGLTQASVSNIDLGSGSNVRVRGVTVHYSPGRLARGIIDGLRIEQPEVPLGIDATGLDYGVLSRFLQPSGGAPAGPGMRLLGPLTVSAGLLNFSSPLGEVDAAVEGVVLLTDGIGSDASIEFALQHPKAKLSGRARGILDPENQLQLTLDIQNASSEARVAFAEMKGAVNISGDIANALQGGGSLTLEDVRIDDVPVGNVDLAGEVNGKSARAEFLLGGTGTGLSMQMQAVTDDVFDPVAKLRLSGEVATDGLKGPFALPIPIDVVGALDFDVTGSRRDFQALPGMVARNAVRSKDGISGWVDLTHLGIAAPNGVDATLDGKLNLGIDPRGWRLKPDPSLNFDLGVPGSGPDRRFALSLAGLSGVPFLAGGPTAADPLRIASGFDGLFNGWFPFAGDAGGTLWPATTDGLMFENVAVRFDPWQMRVGGMDVVADQIGVRISGPLRELELELAADAGFSGSPAKDVSIEGGRISLAGSIGYGPDGIRVFPEGCADVRATGITTGAAELRPGPISICPSGDNTPLVHAATGEKGLKRVDIAAILNSTEIALKGMGPYPLSGTLPRFDGTASFDAARGTWWAKFSSKGGNLKAEGLDLAVATIDGNFNLEGREKLLSARVDLTGATITDARRPMRVAPLMLKGKGEYTPSSVGFKGDVGFMNGPEMALDARYRVSDRRGALQADLPAWSFTKGRAQPQDLFPPLKGLVTDVSGSLKAEARIGWTGSRTTSTAKVELDEIAFGTAPAEVGGVSGTVEITDLLNLKTDQPQTLAVGLLDAGMPLRGGTVTFDLPGKDAVHIVKASWPVAGGTLELNNLNIPFDRPPDLVVANLKNLDAADLARNLDIDGLEADGALAGSIPVRITDDGPVIDDARIWSLKNGGLKFRSKVALESLKQSGEMAELLSRALSDFRYTDLQVSMNGPLSGDITAKAKLDGANPALYDGKRIELNVSLQGALRDLLQSASVIQDLPGNIRDQVQGPSGKP